MNNPLSFDAALPNLLTALDASGKVTAGTRYLNDATSGLLSDKAAQTLLNTAAQPAEAVVEHGGGGRSQFLCRAGRARLR